MEDNKVFKFLYTLFLGVLLAVFVGVGINAFYQAPKPPTYASPAAPATEPAGSATQQQSQYYNDENLHYQQRTQDYNRNVSIIALCAAVIFVAVSILGEKRVRILSDGIMLGGLFTLFYSIVRSFNSANDQFVFIIVSAGVAIVLYLGYHQFARPHAAKK